MSSKSHPNPSLGLRKSHDGKAARNQGPNRTKGPKGCAHVQGEAREADLMAPNGRSKSLGLDGRYARALARTRAPKTLAALLAAGGLVLAVPLLPQPAMACGTVLISTIVGAGAGGYSCTAGPVAAPITYTFYDSMVELGNPPANTASVTVQVLPDRHVLSFRNLDGTDGVYFAYNVLHPTRTFQNIFHNFTSSVDVPLFQFGVQTGPSLPATGSTSPTTVEFYWETMHWIVDPSRLLKSCH